MHGNVGPAVEDRSLHLFHEDPGATDLPNGSIMNEITGGIYQNQFDTMPGVAQSFGDGGRLSPGLFAASGRDAEPS